MNSKAGFLHSFVSGRVAVCRSVEDPRGARHWGRIFVSRTSHEAGTVKVARYDVTAIWIASRIAASVDDPETSSIA